MRVLLKFCCDHSLHFNLDVFFFVQQFGLFEFVSIFLMGLGKEDELVFLLNKCET